MINAGPPVQNSPTETPTRTTQGAEAGASGQRASKWSKGWVISLALLACAAVFLAYRLLSVANRLPELRVVAATRENITRVLAVTGSLEAARSVVVSPRLPGRISAIIRREGERVRDGDTLAVLADDTATALTQQQQASLHAKEAELSQADRELSRTQNLAAAVAVSHADLERARLAVTSGAEEVLRLRSVLRDGRSQQKLVAPFDGTIVRRNGEVGQVVGPETAVFEIASVDDTRVSAEIDERYVRVLRPGMRSEVLPVGSLEGKVGASIAYVAQAVNPQTGAATVRFAFDSAVAAPLVGMSMDVNVHVEVVPDALTVPREAVGGTGSDAFVLLVDEGSVVHRSVVVDDWPAADAIVHRGLASGDLIALDPKAAVAGAKVRTLLVKALDHAL
jgi:RND family efflux transporter MFP subunit